MWKPGTAPAPFAALANIAYWLNRPLTWNPKKEKFEKG